LPQEMVLLWGEGGGAGSGGVNFMTEEGGYKLYPGGGATKYHISDGVTREEEREKKDIKMEKGGEGPL